MLVQKSLVTLKRAIIYTYKLSVFLEDFLCFIAKVGDSTLS